MRSRHTIIVVAALVFLAGSAWPQETSGTQAQEASTESGAASDTNAANNPVNPQLTIDLQNSAGVGDLTVYDLALSTVHGITIGVGPLITAPTARSEAYVSGKWQAGAAGIVLKAFNWGLLGVLINYRHSFSGNSSSPAGQVTTAQPIAHYNFHRGFYLRSTGVWTFNSFTHAQYIPLGFGAGKV